MAGLYLVGAWLLVQVAGTVLPMQLHPVWDPLRRDPGFEKIVASLAPKTAEK